MTGTSSAKPIVRTSLADLVYQQLLDSILAGRLSSGSHLHVADIAKEMKVSPSPVRDALQRLASEGLVLNNSNRRATVIRLSTSDVEQLFEVREILECAAAERAAARIDRRQTQELRAVVKQCDALADQPNQKKAMLDLDNQFHLLVAEACGNRALCDEVVQCNRRIRIIQWLRLEHRKMRGAYHEHVKVIQALERQDPEAARRAMGEHIRNSLQNVLSGLAATSS